MAPIVRFNVRSRKPELLLPAKPTPREVLNLSDLDNEPSLLYMVPALYFYNCSPSMAGKDPVRIMKDGLARTLVFYYPLAGRLRQSSENSKKRVVDCTGETGIVFIEADADISIKDLGSPLHPPFTYVDDLMNQVPHMVEGEGVLNSPIIHIQVTRMKCGGFVLGCRVNNCLMDAVGMSKFLRSLSEIAKGAMAPSIPPVWQRELISARNPPQVTCEHPEFDEEFDLEIIPNMAYRILIFTEKEFAALRNLVPPFLGKATSFELITTLLWRTRVLAYQFDSHLKTGLSFAVNVREKYDPPLPEGYYGNSLAYAGVMATEGELRQNPYAYALAKVMKAKRGITDEYMRSYIDELVRRDYPSFPSKTTSYFVSDLRHVGVHLTDFGWGKPVYGGPAHCWYEPYPHMDCTLLPITNIDGKRATLAALCLPAPNMELFVKELRQLIDMRVIDPFADPTANRFPAKL